MEDLRRTAVAYYESATAEEKNLAAAYFISMDQDGDDQVSLSEFLEFMRNKEHQNLSNRYLFELIDRDRNGSVDFNEFLTLFYIIKSGRPICGQCGNLITALYFACMICYYQASGPFCLCLRCYHEDKDKFAHKHEQAKFMDNFALVELNRKSVLAASKTNQNTPSSSENRVNFTPEPVDQYSVDTSLAIVTAKPLKKKIPTEATLQTVTAGLNLASAISNFCAIM